MILQIVISVSIVYSLLSLFSIVGLLAICCYGLTMFVLLPLVYYTSRMGSMSAEVRSILKEQDLLLKPAIKKSSFYRPSSKADTTIEDDATGGGHLSSITPYPSRRVEEIVDEIIAEVIRYYVLPYAEANGWRFRNTEAFLKRFLKDLASAFIRRMTVMDWNVFLCQTVMEQLRAHVHFLKSRGNQAHCDNYFLGQKTEALFVEAAANRLLRQLLNCRYVQCELVYQFCLGVLAHQVLRKTVLYYADPDGQNRWLFGLLIQRKADRARVRQLPNFQYNMSFESFFRLVDSVNEPDELRKINKKLKKEMTMVEILRQGQLDADSKKPLNRATLNKSKATRKVHKGHMLSQRDLKCYHNQLRTLKETVEARLKFLKAIDGDISNESSVLLVNVSGRSKSNDIVKETTTLSSSSAVIGTEKQTLSKKFRQKVSSNFVKSRTAQGKRSAEKSSSGKESIPFETIIDSVEGRKLFKEFLNNTNVSRTVELLELLDYLQQHPDDQFVVAQTIVKRYIHSSPPAFEFDKYTVKHMEEFLKGNSDVSVFQEARKAVNKELKQRWYPYFRLTQYYSRFAKHLSKELLMIDEIKLIQDIEQGSASENENSDVDDIDESDTSRDIPLTENPNEKNATDEEGGQLLFDFTQSLEKSNCTSDKESELISFDPIIQQSMMDDFTDQSTIDVEDDDKPITTETQNSKRAMNFYRTRMETLSQKILLKEKALGASIEVSNKMPLNKKEKMKMFSDIETVKRDLENLKQKRNQYQYNLNRIDKWNISSSNCIAHVYDIILPEPKRGTSLDLGYISTLSDQKIPGASSTDKEDMLEDDTKHIVVFIIVTLNSSSEINNDGADNGWLVKHTLKDFHLLKKDLLSISASVSNLSLPKVPQRLFMRRKYTDNNLVHIRDTLNTFLKSIMMDQTLKQSDIIFNFLCQSVNSIESSNDYSSTGAFSTIANTISDAGAKVISMAKFPTKIVQKVLAPKKHSASISSLDSDEEVKPEKKSSIRRISTFGSGTGSFKRRMRKANPSKDLSISAFELLDEFIQLRKSLTLTRRSMITLVQSFLGKNLSQILSEKVAVIKSESNVYTYLQQYRDSFKTDVLTLSVQISNDSYESRQGMPLDDSLLLQQQTNNKMHPSASVFLSKSDENGGNGGGSLQLVNSNSSPMMSRARSLERRNIDTGAGGSCEYICSECTPISVGGTGGVSGNSTVTAAMTTTSQSSNAGRNGPPQWPYSLHCDEAVKRLLWEAVPEHWKTLFGTVTLADSIGFVFESMQSLEANKALIYRILQEFLDDLLEEDE